jgi:hypothetical protein
VFAEGSNEHFSPGRRSQCGHYRQSSPARPTVAPRLQSANSPAAEATRAPNSHRSITDPSASKSAPSAARTSHNAPSLLLPHRLCSNRSRYFFPPNSYNSLLFEGQFNFEQSPSNGFDHSNGRKWTGAPVDANREVGGSIADNQWAVGGPAGSNQQPPLSRFVLPSVPASQANQWAAQESRSIGQSPPFANSRPVVVPSAPMLQGVLGNGQSQQASNHLQFPTSMSEQQNDRPALPHPTHPQARQGPMPRLPSFPNGQQPPVIIIPNNGNMRPQGPVASTFNGPSIPNPNLPRVVPSIPILPTAAPRPVVPSPVITPPLQGAHGAHIPFKPMPPNEQENRLIMPSIPNVIPAPQVRVVPSSQPHPTVQPQPTWQPHPTIVVPHPASIQITKPHPQAIQLPPPPQQPERPRQVVQPRPFPPPEPLPQPKPQPSQPSPGLKTASEKTKSSYSTNYCDRAEFSDHDLADLSLERVEYFISNSSCSQQFFQCSIGQTFVLNCPSPKQAFDRSTVNCNFRYNIKTCPEYDHVIHCSKIFSKSPLFNDIYCLFCHRYRAISAVRDTCTAGEFACCGDLPQKCVGLDRRFGLFYAVVVTLNYLQVRRS